MNRYTCCIWSQSWYQPFEVRANSALGARRKAIKLSSVRVHSRREEADGIEYLTKCGRKLWVRSVPEVR